MQLKLQRFATSYKYDSSGLAAVRSLGLSGVFKVERLMLEAIIRSFSLSNTVSGVKRYLMAFITSAAFTLSITPQPTFARPQSNVKIQVEFSEDTKYEAELLQLQAESVVLSRDGEQSTVPFEELVSLRNLGTVASIQNEGVSVTLIDDSIVRCDEVVSSGQGMSLVVGRENISIDAKLISHIQFGTLTPKQTDSWQDAVASSASGDLLVVKQSTGELTKIEGIVLGILEDAVSFELGDQQIPVPFAKIAGIRFFGSKKEATKPARGTLETQNGSRFRFAGLETKNGYLNVDLACGPTLKQNTNDFLSIRFELGNAKYLAEIEPLRFSSKKLFDFPVKNLGDDKLFGFHPLSAKRIPGAKQGPSLEFVGDGEVTFVVPEEFTRLIGTVRLAPKGGQFTRTTVSISLENKVLWEQELTKPGDRHNFDLKVVGDQRLKLASSTKTKLPTGNVVEWIEPSFTK